MKNGRIKKIKFSLVCFVGRMEKWRDRKSFVQLRRKVRMEKFFYKFTFMPFLHYNFFVIIKKEKYYLLSNKIMSHFPSTRFPPHSPHFGKIHFWWAQEKQAQAPPKSTPFSPGYRKHKKQDFPPLFPHQFSIPQ